MSGSVSVIFSAHFTALLPMMTKPRSGGYWPPNRTGSGVLPIFDRDATFVD
jgi:hypothetical protein